MKQYLVVLALAASCFFVEQIKGNGECSCTELQQKYDLLKNKTDGLEASQMEMQRKMSELYEKLEMMETEEEEDEDEDDTDQSRPADCQSVTREQAKVWNGTGGVFDIYPKHMAVETVEVYCDLTTDGGGWTVFQRRMDGSEDFYRDFLDYLVGFGRRDKEFWLGLGAIHGLTKKGKYEMRIELEDWEGEKRYAKYGQFILRGGPDNYTLTVRKFSGNVKNGLSSSNKQAFGTRDKKTDSYDFMTCGESRKSGWWFHPTRGCGLANLNGIYYQGGPYSTELDGIEWSLWKTRYSLKFTEMKFRKVG